jgi:hypothetical protein
MADETIPARPHLGRLRLGERLKWRLRRDLALPLLGAVVGLAIAGTSLLRTGPSTASVVPPGYVALVNQEGILMSDFITQTMTETAKPFAQTTPAERRRVLREMIDEELLVQRGLALDLPETTTEVREVVVSAVNTQAAAPTRALEPTDAELRSFYGLHRSDYTADGSMTLRDLVLHVGGYQNADQSIAQAETDAADAVYQLRAGTSPEYVMEHFGFVDSGRVDATEQLDFAAKLRLGAKLFEIAAALGDGEISDPTLDSDGIHVLIMTRRIPAHVAAFAEVRDRLYKAYQQDQARRADAENLDLLRRDARILLAPGQSE